MLALFFAVLSTGNAALAQSNAQADGLSDRAAYESWIRSLSGEERKGAEYWAGQRSLPNPGWCEASTVGMNGQGFVVGCEESKRRLMPADVRRRSEPSYRLGWNSFTDTVANPLVQPPSGSSLSGNAPWYFASTILSKCTRVSELFPKPGENYPSTPEGIVAGTGGGSAYQISRPGYGPEGLEHHAPGPVVALTDLLGRYPTLALVQGEVGCREALALMLKAGTSGSAEQRWAAQNAVQAAQWHVVYWDRGKIPCVPLSKFVPRATSLEEAVSIIKESDPDAYLVQATIPDEWERIIRTQGHNLRVVQSQMHCRIWFSLVR